MSSYSKKDDDHYIYKTPYSNNRYSKRAKRRNPESLDMIMAGTNTYQT